MTTTRTTDWLIAYTGFSSFNLIECEDGDIVIEVDRSYDELIFDDVSFDVEVKFENGEPQFSVHEGGFREALLDSEIETMREMVAEHLRKK
jgi:hypothetical protein